MRIETNRGWKRVRVIGAGMAFTVYLPTISSIRRFADGAGARMTYLTPSKDKYADVICVL